MAVTAPVPLARYRPSPPALNHGPHAQAPTGRATPNHLQHQPIALCWRLDCHPWLSVPHAPTSTSSVPSSTPHVTWPWVSCVTAPSCTGPKPTADAVDHQGRNMESMCVQDRLWGNVPGRGDGTRSREGMHGSTPERQAQAEHRRIRGMQRRWLARWRSQFLQGDKIVLPVGRAFPSR